MCHFVISFWLCDGPWRWINTFPPANTSNATLATFPFQGRGLNTTSITYSLTLLDIRVFCTSARNWTIYVAARAVAQSVLERTITCWLWLPAFG